MVIQSSTNLTRKTRLPYGNDKTTGVSKNHLAGVIHKAANNERNGMSNAGPVVIHARSTPIYRDTRNLAT